ncbi:hypothetical protein M0657_010516 [Pyricularia oryzae]|nr:hypothetical protein M9X92_010542 [Pyricularia oryzae]KAI7912275.1 hypothetical protein M0657_010516 [Pyricularia oryzae]
MVDNPEQAVHIIAAKWNLVCSASRPRTGRHIHPPFGINITVSPTNTTKIEIIPRPPPAYMVDYQNNYYKTAPDTDEQNGPTWTYSGSLNG